MTLCGNLHTIRTIGYVFVFLTISKPVVIDWYSFQIHCEHIGSHQIHLKTNSRHVEAICSQGTFVVQGHLDLSDVKIFTYWPYETTF